MRTSQKLTPSSGCYLDIQISENFFPGFSLPTCIDCREGNKEVVYL